MLQIKVVNGKTADELTLETNMFLESISDDEVQDIDTSAAAEGYVIIKYLIKEEWKDMMCCDCKYWDDGGEPTTSGLCQECGQRRRFNAKACQRFKDFRRCR